MRTSGLAWASSCGVVGVVRVVGVGGQGGEVLLVGEGNVASLVTALSSFIKQPHLEARGTLTHIIMKQERRIYR